MINAFQPEFMKTHYPDFMRDFRTHEANRQASAALTGYVARRRKEKPTYGTVFGISDKVQPSTVTPPHMHRARTNELLKIKTFHTYAKAHTKK
jgi:hypothetical protein